MSPMKIDAVLRKKIKTAVLTQLKKEEEEKAFLISPYEIKENELKPFYEVFPFLREKHLETRRDESLLAGFILKWGSKIIDASLAGRINNLVNKAL